MTAWMLQSLLAGAMLAGAAVAVEECARLLGRPLRWGWIAAMAAAAMLPLVFRFIPVRSGPSAPSSALDPALLESLLAQAVAPDRPATVLDRLRTFADAADPLVASFWGVVATVMVAGLLLTYRRLRAVRTTGRPVEIAGIPARLTHGAGPMVIGIRRPEVVVPHWVAELPEQEQRLVLRHEWEHVRAGDTRLLMGAAALVALMPWNVALWWMRGRLRQAVEVDCDARVLAAGADRRLYGSMLIHTAGRPRPAPLLAPALVELPSLLERRIIAMTSFRPRHAAARFGAATTVATLLVAGACELSPRGSSPSPTEPTLAEVLDAEEEGAQVTEPGGDAGAPVEAVVLSPYGPGAAVVTPEGDTLRATSVRILAPLGELSPGSAQPLVIVDGQRVASLEQVDPARIASITVLKDPAATERFGEEGANGVVLVRTGTPPPTRVRTPAPVRAPAGVEEVGVVAPATAPRVAATVTEIRAGRAAPTPEVEEATRAVAARIQEVSELAGDHNATAMSARAVEDAVVAVRYRAESLAARAEEVAARPEPTAVVVDGTVTRAAPAATLTPAAAVAEPLIIVDGEIVRSMAELKNRFSPEEIGSIQVIKDASATDAYGERGRNGVIIVELKD